ncbi:MAG: EF-P lysine aminoacylase EpmA [Syntrophales bacterium]|jgi:lysyl-tRNA synthetase class 2
MEQDGRLAKKREILWKRARMIRAIRDFFTSRDYLEVETPHMIPALIPETHIDPVLCGDSFLHTSPELHMKRLLAAGYPMIFQICKCFRDGERGSCHLPEFTMLEWYCRGVDYRRLMEECEELIVSVAGHLGYGDAINYQGRAIGLQRPWESISVREAFACYAQMSMDRAVAENCFDEIMVSSIEPRLGLTQPTFIYDYPASGSALAKQKKDDTALAERFELYMGGKEIANACSELTDPQEHHRRFLNVNKYRHSIGKSIYPVSERFLEDLARMPQSAGIALGVDRLAMIFCDSSAIDDVVSFVPEFL